MGKNPFRVRCPLPHQSNANGDETDKRMVYQCLQKGTVPEGKKSEMKVCVASVPEKKRWLTFSGWWLGHPSEKYVSQLGWWNSQYMGK